MTRLNPGQLDILQEFINIGVGKAAGIINQMSRAHVILRVPEILLMEAGDMREAFPAATGSKCSAVTLSFRGNFAGTAALVFPPESAASLVDIILGTGDGFSDMDSLRAGTLQEVGNIVLNGVMGSITNILHEHIEYQTPDYSEESIFNLFNFNDPQNKVMIARAQFSLENLLIHGDIVIVFQVLSFDSLLLAIDRLAMKEAGESGDPGCPCG